MSAALFWSSCLEGQHDFRDHKTRKSQGRIVRPHFHNHVKRMLVLDGQDDAAVDRLWTQLVKDVRVCSLILIGRESGAIRGETLSKLDSGAIGRTEAVQLATEVSKKIGGAAESSAAESSAAESSGAEGEGEGVDPPSATASAPRPRAPPIVCTYVTDLKEAAREADTPVGKTICKMVNDRKRELAEFCAGPRYGSDAQRRRLDAAAALTAKLRARQQLDNAEVAAMDDSTVVTKLIRSRNLSERRNN